jgi:Asp-tRNA(Asn)/Glu-tRNA(Gln) amidotransferase A subunit family amidase
MGPDRGESSGGLGSGHAITRSVRDSAALLDATAGPDLGAPYGIAPPVRPWSEEIGARPNQLRIALSPGLPQGGVAHPECVASANEAARLCEGLGHIIEERAPTTNFADIAGAVRIILAASVRAAVDGRAITLGRRPTESDLEPVTWAIYQGADRLRADDYIKAVGVIHRSGRDLASFLERFDLILAPTLAKPPVPLGEITLSNPNPDEYFDRFWSFTPYTILQRPL